MNIPNTGTYVDSWWGIYAPARAVITAHALGAPVPQEARALAQQELASSADNPNATDPLTLEQHDTLHAHLDDAENWLNTHRAWPGRTSWGFIDGSWEHSTTNAIAPGHRPAIRFYADIYHHDTDPTGPEDAIDSGYFDPGWSAWYPIPDSEGHPGWEIDLIDQMDDYNPHALALLAVDQAQRWTGTAHHIDITDTTATVYAEEAVDDLRGARGAPLASHWAMRRAEIVNLTPDEATRIADLLSTLS